MKNQFKRIGNALSGPLIGIVLGVGIAKVGTGILEDARYERTRREVQTLKEETSDRYFALDTNMDGIVNSDEWTPVYEFLGLKNTGRYGLDLTTDQLRQYVNSQKRRNTK